MYKIIFYSTTSIKKQTSPNVLLGIWDLLKINGFVSTHLNDAIEIFVEFLLEGKQNKTDFVAEVEVKERQKEKTCGIRLADLACSPKCQIFKVTWTIK